jgi:8-oxo-dGTP pyrophosphatase MutT (NUDIX family)
MLHRDKQSYVAGFMMDYRMDRFIVIDKSNAKPFGPGITLKIQAPGGKIKQRDLVKIGVKLADDSYPLGELIDVDQMQYQGKDENPHEAMSREFEEETGVGIDKKRWHCFMIKEYKEAKIYLFATFVSPNELDYVFQKSKTHKNNEGEIKIVDLIDVFFDLHLFTFDTSIFVQFIKLEMSKGFFTKLDPEGVNSAYKN